MTHKCQILGWHALRYSEGRAKRRRHCPLQPGGQGPILAEMRIHDPIKQWKLSPMDLQSRARWEQYTKAKEEMFERTHIPEAPWWIVEAVDKKRARLNCIHHLLGQVPYKEVHRDPVILPSREHHPGYRREELDDGMYVPEIY